MPTDAVLSLDLLFGCALGAEAAGVPHAMLSPHISIRPIPGVPPAGSGLRPPRTAEERAVNSALADRFVALTDQFLPVLNTARRELGLPSIRSSFDLFDRADRVLLAISRAFDFRADVLPENYRYVGPLLDEPGWSHSERPSWRGTTRPRILIAGSTGAQNQTELLQRVVRAAGTVDVEALLTASPNVALEELPTPGNVRSVPSAPHDALKKEVSLVVSQGGHGTVCRALLHGLPLLVIPMARDQADNAARVGARGAGLSLEPGASEEEIAAAIRQLLAEPGFRTAAERLGEAMRADIDAVGLVREVEAMVAARRAAPAGATRRAWA